MSAPTLHPDFKEFLSCLKSHGVRFIIVGAHALAIHGRPRATADIDVLVQPTAANARKLARALSAFGFPEYANSAADHFSKPDRMATLGKEPIRIDILSSISGVTFSEAWSGRVTAVLGDEEMPFLGLTEMKATKRAAGRTKDLLDLELIRELEAVATRRPAPRKRATKKPRATPSPRVRAAKKR